MENCDRIANLCRICTNLANASAQKLFGKTQKSIVHQIEELTGILLKNSRNLPSSICGQCSQDLEQAYQFRERCLNAQKYFTTRKYRVSLKTNLHAQRENCFNDNNELQKEIEFIKLTPIKEELIHANIKTEELLLKEEIIDEKISNDHLNHFDNFSDSKIEIDTEFNKVLIEKPLKAETQNQQVGKREKFKKSLLKSKSSKSVKQKLKTTAEWNSGRKYFICDQCGNHVTGYQHFLTHLRRHTGDKQFQCEVCPDKFFTHSELKRHIRKHTGEKPFACKHCSRSFSDYSTRIKHERTHTNERPFACTQCSKAFTTSYLLKNHKLIHTGERAFKCNACNKSFQRQSHLVVHFRSIMHKQNEEKLQKFKPEITDNNDKILPKT